MEFQEKYTSTSEKARPENTDKKIIGDDDFAIGDIIQQLINQMEHNRLSNL